MHPTVTVGTSVKSTREVVSIMDTGIDAQGYAAQATEAVNSIRSKTDEKKKAWSFKIAAGEISGRLRSQA